MNARQPLACPRPPAPTAAAAALSRRLLPGLRFCARRFPLLILVLLLLLLVLLDGDLCNGDRAVGYRVEDRIAVERIHLPHTLHMLEQAVRATMRVVRASLLQRSSVMCATTRSTLDSNPRASACIVAICAQARS